MPVITHGDAPQRFMRLRERGWDGKDFIVVRRGVAAGTPSDYAGPIGREKTFGQRERRLDKVVKRRGAEGVLAITGRAPKPA
jgi:hypothetical protein